MAHLLEVNRAAVLDMFGKDNQAVREELQILRKWLTTQPHLPHVDDVRLEKILVNCKFSLEATKDTVDSYFTMRSFLQDFFGDLDPLSPTMQRALRVASVLPLKTQTKNCERVMISQVWDTDGDKYSALLHIKCMIMIEELRIRHDYEFSNHVIVNLNRLTFANLMQHTPDLIVKIMKLYMKGYKFRFAGIHIVNAPTFVDMFLKVLKLALSDKIYKRLVVHETLESLHKIIPQELLPSDLGGNLQSSQELNEEWIKELEANRDWFLEQQKIRVNESKRPEKLQDQYFGSIHGTFKTLNVD